MKHVAQHSFFVSDDEIRDSFDTINRHKNAPHKPLMLMLMLGHCWNNGERLVLFRNVVTPLWVLLNKFHGVARTPLPKSRTLYPFVFLASDKGIWEVTDKSIKDVEFSKAKDTDFMGGFTEPLYRRIINDKNFILELAIRVHKTHLREENLSSLLDAVNIPNKDLANSQGVFGFERSCATPPEKSCTVCDEHELIKTHVKWPIAGGPKDVPNNMLYMCGDHKQLFDHGIITFSSEDRIIRMSRDFEEELAEQGVDKNLLLADRIKTDYLRWHNKEVFVL